MFRIRLQWRSCNVEKSSENVLEPGHVWYWLWTNSPLQRFPIGQKWRQPSLDNYVTEVIKARGSPVSRHFELKYGIILTCRYKYALFLLSKSQELFSEIEWKGNPWISDPCDFCVVPKLPSREQRTQYIRFDLGEFTSYYLVWTFLKTVPTPVVCSNCLSKAQYLRVPRTPPDISRYSLEESVFEVWGLFLGCQHSVATNLSSPLSYLFQKSLGR